MPASLACPGAAFFTDSLVNAIRRGRKWATAPQRTLARVWNKLIGYFDDPGDACRVIWVPSHTAVSDIGKVEIGDGSRLTKAVRDGALTPLGLLSPRPDR